jgi:tetratricopeptide (TPR) repeat protein
MANPKHMVRLVVTQHSYRMANRLRQALVLAEYKRRNIFEVIEANELLQTLRDASPIHLAMLTPAIVAELERQQLHKVLRTQFPKVALLLLGDGDGPARKSRSIIIPDYVLMPPITAESLDAGIVAALENRRNRTLAAEHIAWGEAAIKRGLLAEAQTSFEAAVHISSSDPYPCYALGDLFATLGDTGQAIAYFTQAWEREPTYFEAVRRIVEILLSRGERARAIPYLERAAKEDTAPVESLVLLGVLYLGEGMRAQADVRIRSACCMDMPRAISAILEQARALVDSKAIDESIALLQIGIEMQPENPQLYEALGDLFMRQDRLREAVVCYENHARLGDPLPANYCRLARVYMAMGFRLRAEKALEAALKLDPGCAEATELRVAVAS